MRAHHIMTRGGISVSPDATIGDAARLMLENHISGLPVVDKAGSLVGIVTERDFLRRQEVSTQRKRPRWLEFIRGPGLQAQEYTHSAGRKVHEIMTRNVQTITEDAPLAEIVASMEKHRIKRIPVTRDGKLVGIVSRQNFVAVVASMSREVPDPTADDEHIRERILATLDRRAWTPISGNILVRNGVVDIHGILIDENVREGIIVAAENTAGVKEVHDHLCWVDPMSGMYFSPDEELAAKAS